ncbi:hypothetical protein Ancab_014220 [Ancistrocladus abbreviatus]
MSPENQAHYPGPNHAPPPQPPPLTTHLRLFPTRTRGGTGCWCLDCLCDCGCCVLSCVLQIIFSILVFIGLIILVVWLIVRPHALKFHASDASLTQFSLSSSTNSNSTLLFNLALNFTVRNPNRHIGVYFDEIDISAYYEKQRFSTASLALFYQGHKNTTDLGPVVFKGQSTVVAASDLISDYNGQKGNGVFDIDVKLKFKVRFKLSLFKTGRYKPKVECNLKIPLNGGNSSSGQAFQATKCHYDL